MKTMLSNGLSEGILLVYATSIHLTKVFLYITSIHALFTLLVNTYRHLVSLHVDGDILYSNEGTTQGDPLTIPFYALAVIPLIQTLPSMVKQARYADGASACDFC